MASSASKTDTFKRLVLAAMSRKVDTFKRRVLSMSRKVEVSKPPVFQIPLVEVTANKKYEVRKKTFGEPAFGVPEKVILVVGATGVGKTTFINGIFNYIVGVEWEDDYRFRLVEEDIHGNQAESITKWITAYTIHYQEGFRIPFTLTIIDTPGFGSTAGIEQDKQIAEQLKYFLETTGEGGIDHIDAVGFVTTSAPRLTPTQRFIFDSILSLFRQDIKDNIFLLITFADNSRPPVLDAVKSAELPYRKYFKFNNSALFASNEAKDQYTLQSSSDEDEDDRIFSSISWKMGKASYKKFFLELGMKWPGPLCSSM